MGKYTPKQFSPRLYPEWGELYCCLNANQMSELLKAITMFPNYEPTDVPIWGFIKSQITKDYEEFVARSESNQKKVKNYWENKSEQRLTMANHSEPITKTETKTETKTKTKKTNKKSFSENFENWWKECPRKVSKADASKKFEALLKEKITTFDELFEGIKRYAQHCREKKVEEQYIKHPSTWLNQGCWNDEYSKDPPPPKMSKEDEDKMWEERFKRYGVTNER